MGFCRPSLRRGRRLRPGDRLVVWTKPKNCPKTWSREEFALLPATLVIRLIRSKIAVKGFRTQEVTLATTLVDPVRSSAETLRALYVQRWDIELHFAQLKTLLEMGVLRCQGRK